MGRFSSFHCSPRLPQRSLTTNRLLPARELKVPEPRQTCNLNDHGTFFVLQKASPSYQPPSVCQRNFFAIGSDPSDRCALCLSQARTKHYWILLLVVSGFFRRASMLTITTRMISTAM